MKIAWIINTIFPYPAEKMNMKGNVFGGWLNALFENIRYNEKIKKIIIISFYNGIELKKIDDKNIIYYLIPIKNKLKYNKKLKNKLINIYKVELPDVVHIHGTEYPYSLSAIEACKATNIKSIVSIQGLVSVCGLNNNYYAGLSLKGMIFNITLRDIIKRDLLFFQAYNFRKRGGCEKKCLEMADCIVGRTSWDYANVCDITSGKKYLKCNESLRNSFYEKTWDINKATKHTIFVSQASYPLKGFHKLIKAMKLIKREYPDTKVFVAGNNIINYNSNNFKDKIKLTGYGKYLKKLIKKYNLQDSIVFTGLLNEEQLVNQLLNSHVFVQTSSIENSSNSLGEAMLVGMPCVASYVGGTSDMIKDKEEGLLYPFTSSEMLAKYIIDIFNDENLAIKLGKNARKHALETHSVINNANQMIEIYKEVKK